MDSTEKQIETIEEDHGTDDPAIVKRWVAEIELYEEEFKSYHDRCQKILERFRDERAVESDKQIPRFNSFWANNKVIEPSIYSQRAKIEASRRFHDRDPIGRLSCEVIERATSTSLDDDRYDFDGVMVRARQDFELLGRGVVWERYEPSFISGQVTDDKTGIAQPQERLAYEHTCTEHLHYDDFGHTAGARAWEEVSAVWRKAYMTRDELTARFDQKLSNGKVIGSEVPLDYTPKRVAAKKDKADRYSHFKKATIYEIWDRSSMKVYWIHRDYPHMPLDVKDESPEAEGALGLRGFFPCPKPAYGTLTNDSLVPVPDYIQTQDLHAEVDLLTARIKLVTDAIKAKGGYAKELGDLSKILKAKDNDLVPVDIMKFASSAGGADLRKLIFWMPIEQLVATLQVLYDARDRTKAALDEISGNFDMMRGISDPRETATAQQGKMTYSSKRMETKVSEFARFVRDLYRIKAEIICEKFKPETIALMVGFDPQKSVQDLSIPQIPAGPPPPSMPGQPPQPQQMLPPEVVFGQALELMRNDTLRAYRIDIETDSTIALDEQTEQAKAGEFLQSIGNFFSAVGPIIQQVPAFGKPMGKVMLATARRYKFGRSFEEELEVAIDEALNSMQQQQQQQPQQDPRLIDVQQKGQAMMAKQQSADLAAQGKMALEQEKLKLKAAELQQKGMQSQQELQLKGAIAAGEMDLKRKQVAAEVHIQEQETIAELLGQQEEQRVQHTLQGAQFAASEQEREHRQAMAERQPKGQI